MGKSRTSGLVKMGVGGLLSGGANVSGEGTIQSDYQGDYDLLAGVDSSNTYNYIRNLYHTDDAVKQAINDYSGVYFDDMNLMADVGFDEYAKIKNVNPNYKASVDYANKMKKDVDALQKALSDAPKLKYDTILNRSMNSNHYMNDLKVGDVGKTKNFLSTTANDKNIYNYESDVEFRVKAGTKAGVYLSSLSKMPQESEFLLAKGLDYKVLSKVKNNKGGYNFVIEIGK